MKNVTLLISLICVAIFPVFGQRPADTRAIVDQLAANRAVTLTLNTNKALLEPNEVASLVINVLVPPRMNEDGTMADYPYTIPLPIGDPTPYKPVNWKILQGGGNLVNVDDVTASYSAPAHRPAGGTMVISVDLVPTRPGFAKVILLQTLYFTENESAVYVNLPEAGFPNSKYVTKRSAGVAAPTMQGVDPRAAARMSPELREKMAQAQAAMASAQASAPVNLSAVTSNAMAIYAADGNETAVKFTAMTIEMRDGHPAPATGTSALFMFNFKGKGVGTYKLDEKNVGVGFLIPGGQGVACGKNQNGNRELPCDGTVKILTMDDKIITGTISTTVYTAIGNNVFRGFLHGKFVVNRAN